MNFEDAKKIWAAFAEKNVEYTLIGSMALAAHGLTRATRDIDFFVAPNAANIDKLRSALNSLFPNDPDIQEITSEALLGEYPVLQYVPPHQLYAIDIMTRLGSAAAYDSVEQQQIVIDGIPLKIATPLALFRLKKDSLRPQDRLDAEALRQKFSLRET